MAKLKVIEPFAESIQKRESNGNPAKSAKLFAVAICLLQSVMGFVVVVNNPNGHQLFWYG